MCDKSRAEMLTVLRGLLAEERDSIDDRWQRVILEKRDIDAAAEGQVLEVPGTLAGRATEDVSNELREMVGAFRQEHGRSPSLVRVGKDVVYSVVRAEPGSGLSLAGKVALVTGSAGAIGAGICRGLLEAGCNVVATDISAENLASLVEDLSSIATAEITGVVTDVTDEDSVAAAYDQAALKWGGVDIVVINAGIAHVALLVDMDPEAFRNLEKVNIEGTLLTLAESGRHMMRQGTGGDIVLTSTKNVFAPGASFGAYSSTKAGSHQLARIASLEFAADDIRVNMVSPDAVFSDGDRKSGLWAEVGPSRMKARGLDEDGLEEYYRGRNLLKSAVTPRHVFNAVHFFVTRQTPTTGATIPVDGGLPDATPR